MFESWTSNFDKNPMTKMNKVNKRNGLMILYDMHTKRIILIKMSKKCSTLFEGFWETVAEKKFKEIKKNLKIPYFQFI